MQRELEGMLGAFESAAPNLRKPLRSIFHNILKYEGFLRFWDANGKASKLSLKAKIGASQVFYKKLRPYNQSLKLFL